MGTDSVSIRNYSTSLYAPKSSPTFTGTVTIPTPFTLGAVSVLPTGTELNYVDGVTSAIQTQLDAKMAKATPRVFAATGVMDSLATSDTIAVTRCTPTMTMDSIFIDQSRGANVAYRLELVDSLNQLTGAITLLNAVTTAVQVTKDATFDSATLTNGRLVRLVFTAVTTEPKHFLFTIYAHE
jgi:predicted O-methyltransferase YrrM